MKTFLALSCAHGKSACQVYDSVATTAHQCNGARNVETVNLLGQDHEHLGLFLEWDIGSYKPRN